MVWVPIVAAAISAAGAYAASKSGEGSEGKHEQKPLYSKEQQPLFQQAINAATGKGGGGAFGNAADYYRDLMSDNPQDLQAFQAPEMRRFREETIPGISEQFAGMGSGGLSSSGFRNAAVGAGTDLSERLGQIRANLRMQGAQGLMNIGNTGLSRQTENVYYNPTPGFADTASKGFGNVATQAAGQYYQDYLDKNRNATSTKGTSSPYGGGQGASQSRSKLPDFNPNLRQ